MIAAKKSPRFRQFFILLPFLLLFMGCTTPNMIMKSWVGHSEDELYRRWGPPTKTIDNGRDGRIVKYVADSNATKPAYGKHATSKYVNAKQPTEYITPRNNEYIKTKSFYVTPLGNIYAWKWE